MLRRAVAALVLAAVAGACSDDAQVTVASDAPQTEGTATTTDDGPTATIARRDTPLGELVVTRGPALQPWHFDPNGPTDRWREPSRCYLPRLTLSVGDRSTTIGDAETDGTLLVPLTLREEPDDRTAAVAVVVFDAVDGRRYQLSAPEGADDAVAAGGLAVLVRPAEVDPSAEGSAWMDFTVHETDDSGTVRELPVDLATAEHAFYAGDTNSCPGNTGVTPRPTVPAPVDTPTAAATAARALDPSTPPADALALFGDDPGVAEQLQELHARLAELAPTFKVSVFRIVPDDRDPPVFHGDEGGWVPVALTSDEGFSPMTTWAKVVRHGDSWQVDPRSVCGAFEHLILGAPPSCGG